MERALGMLSETLWKAIQVCFEEFGLNLKSYNLDSDHKDRSQCLRSQEPLLSSCQDSTCYLRAFMQTYELDYFRNIYPI